MKDRLDRERLFDPEAIRVRLRAFRLEKGLEVKEFAEECGLNQWSVYKKEGGKVDWQTSDFVAIGKRFGAPALYPLLDWGDAERLQSAEEEVDRLRGQIQELQRPPEKRRGK